MTRRLATGFVLTLVGALIIEVSVLLALTNLIGLSMVSHIWLITALLIGATLLLLGWLC